MMRNESHGYDWIASYGWEPLVGEPDGWRDRVVTRLFRVRYRMPCGCEYYADRDLTNPGNFPRVRITGVREVTTASGLSVRRGNPYASHDTCMVAVYDCERCGDEAMAYIPFTKMRHHEPGGTVREDVVGEDAVTHGKARSRDLTGMEWILIPVLRGIAVLVFVGLVVFPLLWGFWLLGQGSVGEAVTWIAPAGILLVLIVIVTHHGGLRL